MSKQNKLLFFTTPTCQLCKVIKNNIDSGMYKNCDIETVNVVKSEDFTKCVTYSVRSFPSIVDVERNKLIVGQSNCLMYLEELS